MNLLFVHDHIFKFRNDKFYSSGGLPAGIWPRYLSVFSSLTVVGRDGGKLRDDEEGYTKSSLAKVSFALLPNVSNLKSLVLGNSLVKERCRELVSQHDGVIVRLPSRLGQIFVSEAIKQNKPYAIEVVACPWDALWNYGNWKGKLLAPFATLNLKRTVALAPFVLYVTESFLQNRYPCLKGMVTSCSNVEIAAVENNVIEVRSAKLAGLNRRFRFGLIGNYSSNYKGIDIAIRALAMLNSEALDWELQVLGSGDSRNYQQLAAELGVSDKVSFIGSLPSGQPVYDWLDTVDVYLQPSFQEGLPRALVEAMSRGCPALATNIAGIPELLEPSELVKAGDYQSLSSKIHDITNDHERLYFVAKENFQKAKNYYKPVLDVRRTEFWRSFRDYVDGCVQ